MKKIGSMLLLAMFVLIIGCGRRNEQEEVKKEPETVGEILLADFESYKAENPEATAQETAEHLVTNPLLSFGAATMPVEEGLLTGFNNAEITGFKEGVMFAPMIGTIPFVGYVFTLDEGTDTDGFVQQLTEHADLRWNICTEADEAVTGKSEDMVFFVMSPTQFEDAQ